MPYLLNVRLQGAIKGPRLHMLRDQALLLEDVQSQTLLHWPQVWVRDSASLCFREKTKKLLELREQEMVGHLSDLSTILRFVQAVLLVAIAKIIAIAANTYKARTRHCSS